METLVSSTLAAVKFTGSEKNCKTPATVFFFSAGSGCLL